MALHDLQIETGLLESVDGSCRWTQGISSVLSSASGPLEIKPREELPTLATLEVHVRPAVGVATTRESLIQEKIFSSLDVCVMRDRYPRSLLQVVVQIMEPGESSSFTCLELSTSINSAYTALLEASIPMRSVVLAAALCFTQDNELIIWPTSEQLESSKSNHAVAYSITNYKIDKLVIAESAGTFTREQFFTVLDEGKTVCLNLCRELLTHMESTVEKDFIWKNPN